VQNLLVDPEIERILEHAVTEPPGVKPGLETLFVIEGMEGRHHGPREEASRSAADRPGSALTQVVEIGHSHEFFTVGLVTTRCFGTDRSEQERPSQRSSLEF